jgi:DNA-binding transcriptional LysR family regulator
MSNTFGYISHGGIYIYQTIGGGFLNLDYLKSFYYIAKSNSISKASKILHISQPGLSIQIKKLETELGHALLSRSSHGVLLTSVGEVVFDYAKSIFKLEENLYENIKNLDRKKDQLSIAACKNFGSFYFASKVHHFKELYQNSDVTIDTYNSSTVFHKVLNYDYNIGIVIESDDYKDVEKINFFKDRLVLCTNPAYPDNTVTVEQFLSFPIILREKSSSSYSLVNKFIKKVGLQVEDLNVLYSCNCTNIIKNSIIKGPGFSFLPKSSIEFELKNNLLKEVKLDNINMNRYLSFNYSLIKRKQYDLNFYEKNFKEFLFNI